jgi:hypothetical protein
MVKLLHADPSVRIVHGRRQGPHYSIEDSAMFFEVFGKRNQKGDAPLSGGIAVNVDFGSRVNFFGNAWQLPLVGGKTRGTKKN